MNPPRFAFVDNCFWVAGIVFVAAIVAETAVAFGVGVSDGDSATRIARGLADHDRRLLLICFLSVIYTAAFPVYLVGLYALLRRSAGAATPLATLVLIGGSLMIALHATSDVGITGLLGAKLATFSSAHDPGISYTLYLLTYAFDSVGDVFGSLFAVSTGILALRSGALPRWLAWTAVVFGALLFLQGFTVGGVVAPFGVVIDGVGFILFLLFVLATSIHSLRLEARTGHHP